MKQQLNNAKNSKTKLIILYPWLVWFLSSSFIFYKYLLQVSPTVMVGDLMRTFSLTGLSMGNLAAYYFYAYLLMQLPVGLLLDHFSPRRLMSLAIIVCSVGAIVFSQAMHLSTAEFGRLLIGLGGAFSAVGTMKLISIWFPTRQFALVSGLMMTMAMLGAVGAEAPLALLVADVGWREALLLLGFVGIILSVAVWLFIKDDIKQRSHEKPSFSLKGFKDDLFHVIHNKQSWLISCYSGLAFAPVSAFAGLWGVPYLMQRYEMSRSFTAGLISLTFVGFAIGSPLAGWISDRICRRKPIMIIGTTMSLLTLSIVIYLPIPAAALGFLLLVFGFFSGFFFVSFAHMREINILRLGGTAIGFINMFNALYGALAEPLVGKLLDLGWHHHMLLGARIFSNSDYKHALIVLPIGLGIALFLQFFIKETMCRPC